MSALEILALALALAMDAFAVAVATGMSLINGTRRQGLRLSWHFGFFQWLMTILGWIGGLTLQTFVLRFGPWIAFALLVYIGLRMLWESFQECGPPSSWDPTAGSRLVVLSLATSIDALAVGLSLALLKISIWGPALVIGVVALILTSLGFYLGQKLGQQACWGQRAEAIGGLILLFMGCKILWQSW